MINLIAFGVMVAVLSGIVFWLAHNTNAYNKEQRERRAIASLNLNRPIENQAYPLKPSVQLESRLASVEAKLKTNTRLLILFGALGLIGIGALLVRAYYD